MTERWRTHHNPPAQQSRGPATCPRNPPACELRTNMVGGTKTPGWSGGGRTLSISHFVNDRVLNSLKQHKILFI